MTVGMVGTKGSRGLDGVMVSVVAGPDGLRASGTISMRAIGLGVVLSQS